MNDSEASLDEALKVIGTAISGASLEAVLRNACQPMLEQAQHLAPKRTGNLVRHIQMRTSHRNNSATAIVEVADSGKDGKQHEAIFAEFGTSKQVAEPFMRPAFDANKNSIRSAIEQHLEKALRD